jgi:glycosyltransferase involved in cell wall biosynthesis
MAKLVSILVPVHNAAAYVGETIECALAQTWRWKEIIAVDDGSTDQSFDILKTFEQRSVKIIRQENRGASSARNRALSEAQGEFVQFLDSDDLLSQNKIQVQIERLQHSQLGSIASCSWARFRESVNECVMLPSPVWKDLSPVEWVARSWNRGGMMPCHAWLTPREVIRQAGPWDETPCPNDDGEFFTRVVLTSKHVVFCESASAYYRSVPYSFSSRKDSSALAAVYRSLEICARHLLDVEDSERTRASCAALFQDFVYNVYPYGLEYVHRAEEMVVSYGGTNVSPQLGGRWHQVISLILGWKVAARIKRMYLRLTL